jgi:hypothetical protein
MEKVVAMQSIIGTLHDYYIDHAKCVDIADQIPVSHVASNDIEQEHYDLLSVDIDKLMEQNAFCLTAVYPQDYDQRKGGYWCRYLVLDDHMICTVTTINFSKDITDLTSHITGVYIYKVDKPLYGIIPEVHFSPMLQHIEPDLTSTVENIKTKALDGHILFWDTCFPSELASAIGKISCIKMHQYMKSRDRFEYDFRDLFSYVVVPDCYVCS